MNVMAEKTKVYPYRAPKKYPKKSLHGRPRFLLLSYKDFKRFQNFYVNVFGWDMFELPEAAGGAKKGSDKPSLLIATGPSYETWEGLNPGHMNCMAEYAQDDLIKPTLMAEIHMDRPVADTVAEMVEYGATLVGELPQESDGWVSQAFVKDPSDNDIKLWKCPPSRTWEEAEAGYDKE
jgi:hypothetical protein